MTLAQRVVRERDMLVAAGPYRAGTTHHTEEIDTMAGRFDRDADRHTVTARSKAEAAFRQVTTKPVEAPPAKPVIPGARELVSIRLDQEVLAHFQADGPGWQERINAALRQAAGL